VRQPDAGGLSLPSPLPELKSGRRAAFGLYAWRAMNCPSSRHCAMVYDCVALPAAAGTSRLKDVLISRAGFPDGTHGIDMEENV